MTRSNPHRWLGAAGVAIAAAVGVGAALSGGSQVAAASADFAALAQPPSLGLPAPVAQQFVGHNPGGIDLAAARQVVSDVNGTMWIAPATDGTTCIIWSPTAAGAQVPDHPEVTLLVSTDCLPAAVAAAKGIVVTRPGGAGYGVAPDGIRQVRAVVDGTSIPLTVTSNGGSSSRRTRRA